jgi:hypothetical protein
VLVRLDHVASSIVNADHRIMSIELGISDCVRDGVWFAIPQPSDWQNIANQIETAMIFARAYFLYAVVRLNLQPTVWAKSGC